MLCCAVLCCAGSVRCMGSVGQHCLMGWLLPTWPPTCPVPPACPALGCCPAALLPQPALGTVLKIKLYYDSMMR